MLPTIAIKALSEPKGVKAGAIGAKYDPTQTYSQGDLVYKSGKIYRALEDAITGEWDPTKWEQTDILEQLMELIAQSGSVSAIGRFLSDWNCTTGKPETDPPTLPYTYLTGDYYIIGTIAEGTATNYKPDGTQYTGAASTTVDTGNPAVLSMYRFDGTSWTYLDFGQAFRTYLNNYYTKSGVDNLLNLRVAKADIETSLPATPTDTKVPSTKLIHDQDELRVAKADINTSMPTTPSNTKVPSTKLLHDQLETKADTEDVMPAQTVVCYDGNGIAHTYSINMQELNI